MIKISGTKDRIILKKLLKSYLEPFVYKIIDFGKYKLFIKIIYFKYFSF